MSAVPPGSVIPPLTFFKSPAESQRGYYRPWTFFKSPAVSFFSFLGRSLVLVRRLVSLTIATLLSSWHPGMECRPDVSTSRLFGQQGVVRQSPLRLMNDTGRDLTSPLQSSCRNNRR